MKVRSFMIPMEKVMTCFPDDTLSSVVDKMIDNNIGAVVVMPNEGGEYPMGIVTKTDLLNGWQKGLDLQTAKADEVMGTVIETVQDTDSKDMAAEHFEKTKHRHVFVVDKDLKYVGIVGALDIAVEVARDSKAWPYMNRDELAEKYKVPASPKCVTKPVAVPKSPTSPARHTFMQVAGADQQ